MLSYEDYCSLEETAYLLKSPKNAQRLLKAISDLETKKNIKKRDPKKIDREPFSGTGKPEPLKYALKGYWSRRTTPEHRLVYKVTGNHIQIAQCRYHY